MVARKTTCLRRLGWNRAGEERAGRFFASKKVTAAKIVASWGERTGPASAGRHVLAIQDTTAVKFTTTSDRRRGLGKVGHGNIHGILAHTMMAVDADSGACLGLVTGEIWNRPGKVAPLRGRTLDQRYSKRWIETAERAKTVLAPAETITVMGDSESDMYPVWCRVGEPGVHLLVRAQSDRRLTTGGTLFAAADGLAVADTRTIELKARPPARAKRTAKLELRFTAVEICRPVNEKDRTLAETVRLSLVEVREVDAPEGAEPIVWRLLTTHAVTDTAMAWQIVDWYRWRWTIEQLFRVTKSEGLGLEDSRMASAERLMKLAAAALKAACIDMMLVQERDGAHGLPASIAFSDAEIETIEALSPTLEGKTDRQKNPHPPRSLARASWVMGRLGGWNCYYGPPGPIAMRRGREYFQAAHRGRMLGSKLE